MPSNSMRISQEHQLFCRFAMSAGIVLFAAFLSAAKADDKSVANDIHKNCVAFNKDTNLTDYVHVKILKLADWDKLAQNLGIASDEITQVQVRRINGHQYFFASERTASYTCDNKTLNLDVKLHSIEPETNIVYKENPCCTSISGGDAQAKWYSYVNCPLSRPVNLVAAVCGH